ncbi:MAG: hypothetical protein OXI43_09030 [Candidatus Poribacteria bacterium]|nr:hypothetical protein [Candidatus Poribacteria bacterium]
MKYLFTVFVFLSLVFMNGCLPKSTNPLTRSANIIFWGDSPYRIAFMMHRLGKTVDPGGSNANLTYRVKVSDIVDVLCIYTFKKNKLRTAGYILLGSSQKSGHTLSNAKIPLPRPSDKRTLRLRDSDGVLTFVDRQFYDELNAKFDTIRHKNTELTFCEQFIFGHISKYTFLRELGIDLR